MLISSKQRNKNLEYRNYITRSEIRFAKVIQLFNVKFVAVNNHFKIPKELLTAVKFSFS